MFTFLKKGGGRRAKDPNCLPEPKVPKQLLFLDFYFI